MPNVWKLGIMACGVMHIWLMSVAIGNENMYDIALNLTNGIL